MLLELALELVRPIPVPRGVGVRGSGRVGGSRGRGFEVFGALFEVVFVLFCLCLEGLFCGLVLVL